MAGEPDVYVVIEAILAAGIEPAGLTDPPTITINRAYARPRVYEPNTLYLYPDDEVHTGYESGPGVRQDFRLVLDYTVDDAGEQAAGDRTPAVTEALRARAKAYAEWVRNNQRSAEWDRLRVAAIRWLDLSGIDFRGVRMRLDGYRMWG